MRDVETVLRLRGKGEGCGVGVRVEEQGMRDVE